MKEQPGFTLVEVLVAVLVMGLGLLGLAGLQTMSLRNNQSAHFRSVATQAAYDMIDRMRANRVGLQAGAYGNVSPNTDDCVDAACSPQAMARYDFAQWSTSPETSLPSLEDDLPMGTGSVCLDSTPQTADCDGLGDTYAIRISWDDDRSGVVDGNDPVLVTSFRP